MDLATAKRLIEHAAVMATTGCPIHEPPDAVAVEVARRLMPEAWEAAAEAAGIALVLARREIEREREEARLEIEREREAVCRQLLVDRGRVGAEEAVYNAVLDFAPHLLTPLPF